MRTRAALGEGACWEYATHWVQSWENKKKS